MKCAWRHYQYGTHGTARGYASIEYFLCHALQLVNEIEVEVCCEGGPDPESEFVVHCCPSHLIRPYKGKYNILFSMWEGPHIHNKGTLQGLAAADFHIVPSKYCQEVWRNHGLESVVVPLGLASDYIECDHSRQIIRSKPIRYLFVGGPQKRKGWHLIAPAWRMAFSDTPSHVQLHIKTIGPQNELKAHFGGSIMMDTRDLSHKEMLELYRSADVFIFPSYGEGFGLPPLEAMATGCLVISSAIGGLTEFVNGDTALVLPQNKVMEFDYDGKFKLAAHTAEDLCDALSVAYTMWGSPELEMRRFNGIRFARRFTWSRSAEMLAAAVELAANNLQPASA